MFPSKSVSMCVALLLTLPMANASDLTVSQVTGTTFFNLTPEDRLTLSGFGSIPLADPRFGSVSVTVSSTPSPSLVATADIGPSDTPIIFGRGTGTLDYFLEVLGPVGDVPVVIDVAGGATASADSGASFVVESAWDLFDGRSSLAGDEITSGQLSGTFDQSFSRSVTLTLATNHVYSVLMRVDAEAAATDLGSHATSNAFIDPVFSFGAGVDPLVYSFNFSAGIGNSTLVPEPNMLLLLSAGILFLGLFRRTTMWRASRRASERTGPP